MIAVVMGRNYTSLLSMIRAAGVAGYRCIVIRTVHKITNKIVNLEKYSKFVDEYYYSIEPDCLDLISILQNIGKRSKEKIVLLPTDDYTASTIDMNMDVLSQYYLMPNVNNTLGGVVKIMDKNVQKELAKECGLNVSEGLEIKIENGIYTIPDDMKYPCFTKPEISFQGNKNCMKKCNNREELEQVVKEVAKKSNCSLLVEQFIEIEKEYGVLGYAGKSGIYLPCLVEKKEIGSGSHKGVTLIGKVTSLKKVHPIIQKKLEQLLLKTGFMGLIDIDLYESKGQLYFNELNLRLGAFGFAALCNGINLPQMFLCEINNLPIMDFKTEMDSEIQCLSEKVNLEDFCDGYCSFKTYLSRNKQVLYHFIKWNGNDPQPYKYFQKIERQQIVKRFIKNIIGRK